MSNIAAKMHQIRCPLGSAPDPSGVLTALSQTTQLDLRGLILKEGRQRKDGMGRGGRVGSGRTSRKGRKGSDGTERGDGKGTGKEE